MNIFLSIYSILLRAYPKQFRREYGQQMFLLLVDCQRDTRDFPARIRLWLRTLADFVRTLPNEHLHNLRKDDHFMSKLRTDLVAVGGCLILIIGALLLLSYGRSHQVSSILLFGFVLDALVVSGVLGNLIVFLLVKLTNFRHPRVALWTFLIVTLVLLSAAIAIASRVEPHFSAVNIVTSYIVSFLFWYGLHLLWAQKLRPSETA